ncbi:MAG: NAD(P)-binding domain-containing protein [Bryobacteraceae bacterium]|nr:NAD(P)-binding domain-containing protein [Bryobacteraceae bacterium]
MLISEQLSDVGVTGLCAAGRGLALRLAAAGLRVSLLDDSPASVEEFVAQNAGTRGGLVGYADCSDFLESLNTPRRIVAFRTGNDRLAVLPHLLVREPDYLLDCPAPDGSVSSFDLEQIEMTLRFQLG